MPVRSPYPDVEIPDVSLTAFLFGDFGDRADAPAFIDGGTGRAITFGRWRAMSTRSPRRWPSGASGRATSSASSRPTRRTGPRSSTACCAPTPSSPAPTRSTPRASSPTSSPTPAPSCSFTVSPFLDRARGARRRGRAARGRGGHAGRASTASRSLADLLATTAAPPGSRRRRRDTAVLPYSSGTTGRAKGVILTHRNLVANLVPVRADGQCRVRDEDPRRAAVLPHLRHDRADEPRACTSGPPSSRCPSSTWPSSSG